MTDHCVDLGFETDLDFSVKLTLFFMVWWKKGK